MRICRRAAINVNYASNKNAKTTIRHKFGEGIKLDNTTKLLETTNKT
jgi:hypothetical protein